MLKILNILLLAVIGTVLPVGAFELIEEPITLEIGSRISFASKVLHEERELLVHLPEGYAQSGKRYPVLYLLDGERHFYHAITASKLLQEQARIPELIIVGIANLEGKRSRDLGAEKETFTRFLQNELMAYVDSHYRTTGLNTLYGHSLAGYFTVDLLARQPKLFENYIAASPPLTGDGDGIYTQLLELDKVQQANEKSLYFTLASQAEEGRSVTAALNRFVDALTAKAPAALNWHYEFMPRQTHITTYYPTFFNGMTYVFNDYQAPVFSGYRQYLDFGAMPGLQAYYKKRGQKYGERDSIPQSTLTSVAAMLLNEGQAEKALKIYLTVTEEYPDSALAYSGLGKTYQIMEQYDKSVQAHRKSVELSVQMAPDWQKFFKSRLEKARELAQKH
ncbi:hypothetical protein SG34_031820 [Thalassomonas viridans]|uniref:Esterase n=1 Tax=Thalassomonas viridans TaxID=137584 RepID=A0AAE9Z940_9GAMM|nr:alpha/beta hydrolase-fold protein [Thalassomonas viridans]WDE08512.1 hypothetical protein SG34_031820 [Thalassomonas viridans]